MKRNKSWVDCTDEKRTRERTKENESKLSFFLFALLAFHLSRLWWFTAQNLWQVRRRHWRFVCSSSASDSNSDLFMKSQVCVPLPFLDIHSQWQPPTQRQNELGSVAVVDWKWQNLLWLTWHWYKSKQWNWNNNNNNKCSVIKITHGIPIMCLRVRVCLCVHNYASGISIGISSNRLHDNQNIKNAHTCSTRAYLVF